MGVATLEIDIRIGAVDGNLAAAKEGVRAAASRTRPARRSRELFASWLSPGSEE